LDYVFAITLVAGRWLRAPLARRSDETVMLSAFAPAMADSFVPRWAGPGTPPPQPQGSRLVKAAEIVMLSISFFLAAHLLSGGTPTVSAPARNPLGLLPDNARAQTLEVPAAGSRQVEVQAGSFTFQPTLAPSTPIAEVPEQAPVQEEIAVLAPASTPEADAASVEPAATPAPAPEPQPAAVLPPPVPPAPPPASPVAPAGRYLTSDELRAAALAAGWPAETLTDLEEVAWCESRFHTHAEYLGALGLMQVLPNWFEFAGLDKAMWWDPVTNLKAAYAAYREHERYSGDPWSAWTCHPHN